MDRFVCKRRRRKEGSRHGAREQMEWEPGGVRGSGELLRKEREESREEWGH